MLYVVKCIILKLQTLLGSLATYALEILNIYIHTGFYKFFSQSGADLFPWLEDDDGDYLEDFDEFHDEFYWETERDDDLN